ncbi:MAG: hypothetical protein WC554_14510 [Clostridia bacterium]
MKIRIKEFVHSFKPEFYQDYSTCYIRMYNVDDKIFILFEDIDGGLSVTNASEQLASELVENLQLNSINCRFFETYRQYDYETFDEITYTWRDNRASNPQWKPAEEFRNIFLKNGKV